MTDEDRPGSRGRVFQRDVMANYSLNESEVLLVAEISAVLDVIDGLPPAAIAEARLQRTILSRLLGQLDLPQTDAEEARLAEVVSARGRKAAHKRWAAHHA